MNISVSKLCVTVPTKDKANPTKTLLKDLSFNIDSGDVVALMGPSGAGKTTLLNRLVGRGIVGEITGTINYSGHTIAQARSGIGYVTQDDTMFEMLTPRENLTFAAAFLQRDSTAAKREESVSAVMQKLRLVKCGDTIVGTPGLVKGISGGERKRTNVALSLLANPSLLLLDEPTSGLDSKMADELMADVSKVASQGCTCVATIHQPSEAVFIRFKKVMLLEGGHIAYYGPVAGLRDIVKEIGFPVPLGNCTPLPEILLDVLEHREGVPIEEHKKRLDEFRAKGTPNEEASEGPAQTELRAVTRHGFVGQLRILSARNFLAFRRNKVLTRVRMVQSIASALLMGLIFLQVEDNLTGVSTRMFGAFMLTFAQMLFPMLGVLNTFPQERAVFLREAQDRLYSPTAFYLSKVGYDTLIQCFFPIIVTLIGYFLIGLNTEQPDRIFIFYLFMAVVSNCGAAIGFIVSALVSDVSTALSMAPGLVLPHLILSGIFIQVNEMPEPWKTLSYVNLMRYALQGVMTNDLSCDTDPTCDASYYQVSGSACDGSPCDFCCTDNELSISGGICPVLTCDQALAKLGLDGDTIWPSGSSNSETIWYNFICLMVLLVVLRGLGLVALLVSYRRAAKSG